MAYFYVSSTGTRTGFSQSASTGVGPDDTATWNDNALCWSDFQDAMRACIDNGANGDSVVIDSGTWSLAATANTADRTASRTFFIDGRDGTSIFDATSTDQGHIRVNDTVESHDITFRVPLTHSTQQTGTATLNTGIMNENNSVGGAVRFIDTSIANYDVARSAASGSASLFVRNTTSTAPRPIEFDNVDINNITFDSGPGTGTAQNVFVDTNNGILSFDDVRLDDITINSRETSLEALLFRVEAQPTKMDNITVSNLAMTATNNTGGSLKGLVAYLDNTAAMTVNTASFTGVTMDGGVEAEVGAWGFTAQNASHIIMNNVTSTNCHKTNFVNAVGGVATASGANDASNRTKITLNNCTTSNCSGSFGAGGYGTGGGDITVNNCTVTDCESGTWSGDFGIPNGLAWYKGGTGDMLVEDSIATRCNSTNVSYGQAIFSHNNRTTGPTRDCTTTLRRVTVQGTASTALISAVHLRNVDSGGSLHTVLIEDGIYNNDGINEIELAVNNGATLDVVINGAQIKGYTGPANQTLTAYTADDVSLGSLQIVVGDQGGGGTVNLTLTNVSGIGTPTLTTPYSTQYAALNDAVNISVATWTGVVSDGYDAIGLPTGLSMTAQGVITGNLRMGGIIGTTITVQGTDGSKNSAGFNWYITFT